MIHKLKYFEAFTSNLKKKRKKEKRNFDSQTSSNRGVGTYASERSFLRFIVGTTNWFLNMITNENTLGTFNGDLLVQLLVFIYSGIQ